MLWKRFPRAGNSSEFKGIWILLSHGSLEVGVKSRELDSMIFKDPFQLNLFHDFINHSINTHINITINRNKFKKT